jgi:anti-sigma B factor antagonist
VHSLLIQERDAGKVTVLDVAGALTIDSAGDLRDVVQTLLARQRGQILINLAQVTYMDSCGLGEILQAYVSLCRRGGQLKLLKVTPPCRQLLTTAKVLCVLETFESEQMAIRSFPSNPIPLHKVN